MRLLPLLVFLTLLASPVLSQADKSPTALYEEGIQLNDEGKYRDAIEKFKAALSKKPDYVEALYEIGWCYNELADYDNAVIYLEKAKDADSTLADIFFELGYAYEKKDNTDQTIANYKKTLEIAADYYVAAQYLGDIYNSNGNAEAAVKYYKLYLDNNEDADNNYYYRLGWNLNDLGKYEEAIGYLEKYEPQENDDKGKKMTEIGYAHYKNGEYELSILDYSNALDLKPGYATATRGIADSYFAIEEYDNALKYYQLAIAEDEPNSKSCYYRLGWIYNDKENFREAIGALQKAIAYDAKDAANFEELGYAYYMSGNYDDAIAQLDKAIGLKSDSKLGYYYKGLCYVALNDKASAKEIYNKLKPISEEQAEKLLKKIKGE